MTGAVIVHVTDGEQNNTMEWTQEVDALDALCEAWQVVGQVARHQGAPRLTRAARETYHTRHWMWINEGENNAIRGG